VRRSTIVLVVALAACTSNSAGEGSSMPTSRVDTSSAAASIGGPPPVRRPIDVNTLEGRIVFSSEIDDVWTADADGSHVRRVTDARAQEFDPTWSPDGSRIAYRHQTDGGDTAEIYVVDADGSHPVPLTRNDVADWGPDWSPDGRRIVWNSAVGTGGFGFLGTTTRPDGSGRTVLSHHDVEYPAWSPGGRQIAFMAQEPGASGNDPDYNIFVMNSDGSHTRRLTTTPGEDGWPAWSPDGSRIVFSSTRDDCSNSDAPGCRTTGDVGPWEDAWVMDADGSDQHRLTSDFAQFFAWSPDGREIMVAGASSMYVIRPDGSGRADVPIHGVPHPLFPDWIA
jgi:TolB protein